MGICRVFKSADVKDVVFQERAVTEILVILRWRASGDGIFIGGFCEDVSHGGLERLGFWLFLGRSGDALAAQNIFLTEAFVFTRVAIESGAAGTWVVDRRLLGMDGGGHCCWRISRRVT